MGLKDSWDLEMERRRREEFLVGVKIDWRTIVLAWNSAKYEIEGTRG